jgi:hypothetical protein
LALAAGRNIVIVSGQYGVALAAEPLGFYNREFRLSDWLPGLLEEALLAVVERTQSSNVVGFFAQSSEYAKLFRSTPWRTRGVRAFLVSADMGDRGGAQRFVPRALGEALDAYLRNRPFRASSDGIDVYAEQLT